MSIWLTIGASTFDDCMTRMFPETSEHTPARAPVQADAIHPEASAPADGTSTAKPVSKSERNRAVLPVLEQLFALYPHLFGAEFLPLKRGIFQELLDRHPEQFKRDELKAALALHTRSTPYLQCMAAGKARHDLDGNAVEGVAPEHVCQSLLELFRRRQGRSNVDLRPKLLVQLGAAFEASGLSRVDYLACVQTSNAETNALLEAALDQYDQKLARQEALLRAFDGSGKSAEEFADMYGMDKRDVNAVLARRQRQQNPAAKP